MPGVTTDAYGHESASNAGTLGTNLAAGAVSTTAIGTIVPTTAAGASPTVTAVSANDKAGSFTLSPVTGGGAQAAGAVAQVFFAQPYTATPKSVIVNICNLAAGSSGVAVAASAQTVTTTGFTFNVSAALTTANTYYCTFQVAP
jgi:hypothetical protein